MVTRGLEDWIRHGDCQSLERRAIAWLPHEALPRVHRRLPITRRSAGGSKRAAGCPASVKSTRTKDDPGLLRIDFHSVIGEHTLECVPWDEWFKGFEEDNLAFLYEDEKDSRFNKLIKRDKSH